MAFFRAYKADPDKLRVPTYFIESTAPDNVDDAELTDPLSEIPDDLKPYLKPVDPADDAVREIASRLAAGKTPSLVVMVHGFNNPEAAVLQMYAQAAIAVHKDEKIPGNDGLVCVGYRWPSEKMGQPKGSWWSALPQLPRWLAFVGLGILAQALFFYNFDGSVVGHAFFLTGLILAGLIAMAVLLRLIVYFRDNYRAANYGVPDLIHIIRAIHDELGKHRRETDARVELSFIGHSMGGFVVTNTIRTLTDVFKMKVSSLSHFGADAPKPDDEHRHFIGQFFELKRFVLASPDIPAETLLSDRGNFLASALSRFHEAYLFSNEGDEVLRQISTLANYFTFPTKSNDHGFRLGNVEILSSHFGLIDPLAQGGFLETLRVGNRTLRELSTKLRKAEADRQRPDERKRAEAKRLQEESKPAHERTPLPAKFSYFDCTDYVDLDTNEKKRPLLTFAKCEKRHNPTAKMPFSAHLSLLWAYLTTPLRPNVHGGYFEGQLSQTLIYRLACLGFEDTKKAFGDLPTLGSECASKQIRVLLSPDLEKAGHGAAATQVGHQNAVQKVIA